MEFKPTSYLHLAKEITRRHSQKYPQIDRFLVRSIIDELADMVFEDREVYIWVLFHRHGRRRKKKGLNVGNMAEKGRTALRFTYADGTENSPEDQED